MQYALLQAAIVQNFMVKQAIRISGATFQFYVIRCRKQLELCVEEFPGDTVDGFEFTCMDQKINAFTKKIRLLVIDQLLDSDTWVGLVHVE